MTTAASTLITKPGARIAFVLEIEGHDVVYTDVADLTTWTGYTVRPGLQMRGSVSRSMDLLGFDLRPVGFQFELVDAIPWDTTNSLAKLFAHLDATAFTTELTTDLDRDDTTAVVRRTTSFPASGTIYIGHERIAYSGKTQVGISGTFTGLTRGQFPTSADSAASPGTWSHTHKVGTEAGPEVASRPRVWRNRMVTIYAVAVDPDTGTWNSRASSLNELVGLIDDYGFQDGSWQFSCTTIEKRIEAPLLKTQYQGYFTGIQLGSEAVIRFVSFLSGTGFTVVDVRIPTGTYTLDSLIAKVNDQIRAQFGSLHAGFSRGQNVKFTVQSTSASDPWSVEVLEPNAHGRRVLRCLGWPSSQPGIIGGGVAVKSQTAPEPPIATMWSVAQGAVTVSPTSGAWANQSTDDMPNGSGHGYIMVGDSPHVWQVTRSGNTFTYIWVFDLQGRPLGLADLVEDEIVRFVGEDQIIPIKQVWIVKSGMSRLLLRMLLSTGTTNYNHATYDKWAESMGAGFPANLVDIPSIEALGESMGAAGQCVQVLLQPESMASHIESLMRQFGFHLVWRASGTTYKLTATVPTTIATLTPSYTLDVSNTGNDHDTQTASGAELVRNRLTLKYNRDPGSGEFLAQDTYENLSAISEQDEPSALEYEALALYDMDGTKTRAWRTNVAAPMCAYFARPIRKHTRSGSRALWFLSVGDVVLLTDPDAPDAVAGTYGTSSKAWVVGVTKNYETYELESIELLLPPVKAYPYAPSGMLDYGRGDKGYDNATRRLYLRDHEFTRSSGAKDVTYFQVNDRIHISPVDPTGVVTPWERVVEAVGADYLQMTATLSAPAFDSTSRYYVTLADYDLAVLNTNRNRDAGGSSPVSFMADGSNGLDDGSSLVAAYLWGADLPVQDAGTAPSGDDHFRYSPSAGSMLPSTNALAVYRLRDAVFAVNNMYRHTTNMHPVSEQWITARSTSSTSYVQLAGPFKIFCPPGAATLSLSIDAVVTAGTGSFRVTCSTRRPTGDSTTALEFDSDVTQTEVTTTSTSLTKVTGSVNTRPNQEGYCYVTFEFKNSSGANTTSARSVSAPCAARAVI